MLINGLYKIWGGFLSIHDTTDTMTPPNCDFTTFTWTFFIDKDYMNQNLVYGTDKWLHPYRYMRLLDSSCPRFHSSLSKPISLSMGDSYHPTKYNWCNYYSMPKCKKNISKIPLATFHKSTPYDVFLNKIMGAFVMSDKYRQHMAEWRVCVSIN